VVVLNGFCAKTTLKICVIHFCRYTCSTLVVPFFYKHHYSGHNYLLPDQRIDVDRLRKFVSCISVAQLQEKCHGSFDVAFQVSCNWPSLFTFMTCVECTHGTWSHGRNGSEGGRRSPSLKPSKVTLFTMILNDSENSICDIRPFCHPLFYHSSVAKSASSLLQ